MEALERILEGPAVDETFRAFMGYSGWAPGQLENEMKMGSWLTMPANPDLVFNPDATQLWTDVIQQFGDEYSIYSDMPPDPSLN